jgi:molybdopterin converting factor small subunit
MKNKTEKIYVIITNKNRESRAVGTLEYLKKYFGYTLEVGRSWNNKIKWPGDIKTIKSLESNLQKSYEEKEAQTFNRTMVSIGTPTEEEIAEWKEKNQRNTKVAEPAALVNIVIVSEPQKEVKNISEGDTVIFDDYWTTGFFRKTKAKIKKVRNVTFVLVMTNGSEIEITKDSVELDNSLPKLTETIKMIMDKGREAKPTSDAERHTEMLSNFEKKRVKF